MSILQIQTIEDRIIFITFIFIYISVERCKVLVAIILMIDVTEHSYSA